MKKIFLLFVFIFCISFVSGLDVNSSSLEAVWTLRNIYDSKNSHTWTNNGVSFNNAGAYTTAYSNVMTITDDSQFRGLTSMSYSCTVKRLGDTIGGGGTGNGAILSLDAGVSLGRDWNSMIYDSGAIGQENKYNSRIWTTSGSPNNNANLTNTDTNWHCFQVVYDGAYTNLYIDNVSIERNAQTGNVNNDDSTLMLFKYYDSNSAYTFNGYIKDCYFYRNKALNETERKWLCNNNPVNTSSVANLNINSNFSNGMNINFLDNISIEIVGTFGLTTNPFNCNIKLNSSTHTLLTQYNYYGISFNTNNIVTIDTHNISSYSGLGYISFVCSNAEVTSNIQTKTFNFDLVKPTITTNIINNTIYNITSGVVELKTFLIIANDSSMNNYTRKIFDITNNVYLTAYNKQILNTSYYSDTLNLVTNFTSPVNLKIILIANDGINKVEKNYYIGFNVVSIGYVQAQNIAILGNNVLSMGNIIYDGLQFGAIIILIILFVILGIMTYKIFLSISGLFIIWLSFLVLGQSIWNSNITKNYFFVAGFWILFLIGAFFIILGIYITITEYFNHKRNNQNFKYPEY